MLADNGIVNAQNIFEKNTEKPTSIEIFISHEKVTERRGVIKAKYSTNISSNVFVRTGQTSKKCRV